MNNIPCERDEGEPLPESSKASAQWQPEDRFVRVKAGVRRGLGTRATDFERLLFEVVCCLRFVDGTSPRNPDGWHGGAGLLAACYREFYGATYTPKPQNIRRAIGRLGALGALIVKRRATRGQGAGFYLLVDVDRTDLNGGIPCPHSRRRRAMKPKGRMGVSHAPINGGTPCPHTEEQKNDPSPGGREGGAKPTPPTTAGPTSTVKVVPRSGSSTCARDGLGARGFAPPPPDDRDFIPWEEPDREDWEGLSTAVKASPPPARPSSKEGADAYRPGPKRRRTTAFCPGELQEAEMAPFLASCGIGPLPRAASPRPRTAEGDRADPELAAFLASCGAPRAA